ncbi:hypothetical protein ACFE04_029800 [Oxalis oulophora]
MAVDAQHMNFFPQQLVVAERELIKTNQVFNNNNNTQMEYGMPPVCAPPPMADQQQQQLLPFYQQQSDSGLTFINNNGTRKRLREDYDVYSQKHIRLNSSSVAANGDVFYHFQQQQSDINSLIAQHTEKMKMELEERRKSQLRNLLNTVQERVNIKMKEKDEELQRIAKLNWVLQERVKSIYVENQIWRDLAQTNEATANSLRTNLEQVLAHVTNDDINHNNRHVADLVDDAESCCGSSDYGKKEDEVLQIGTWQSRQAGPPAAAAVDGGRRCRKCGEKEASVLLLPCRHLCLCATCGSTLVAKCPVCDSVTNASLHVNMS